MTLKPRQALDVAGNVILGKSTSNNHVINGGMTFFPSSLNKSSSLKFIGLHGDGRWDIKSNDTLFARTRGPYVGFGKGEYKDAGLNTAIGILDRHQGAVALIPRLFIAAGGSGPNNVSQLKIERSDPSEWKQASAYPNGANHYVIRTFLGTPLPSTNHRAPLRIGAYDLSFHTGKVDKQRMIIKTDGKVGIGTSKPKDRLEVTGGNVRVTGGSFIDDAKKLSVPDHVFEDDYSLMPLDELRVYLAKEKHLPKVPSADDISKNGLNLSQFQMRLLEKVEELTLYVLEQQEQIDALSAQVKEFRGTPRATTASR